MLQSIRTHFEGFQYAVLAAMYINLAEPIIKDGFKKIEPMLNEGFELCLSTEACLSAFTQGYYLLMRELEHHRGTDFRESSRQQNLLLILNESYRQSKQKAFEGLKDRIDSDLG